MVLGKKETGHQGILYQKYGSVVRPGGEPDPSRCLRYWTIDYPYLGPGAECHSLLPVARDSECHRIVMEYEADLYPYLRTAWQETTR